MGKYRKSNSSDGAPKQWPNVRAFKTWRKTYLIDRREKIRDSLTPLQFYVTQGLGHERPFTGDHWWTKDVGMYSCICCT